VHRGDRDVQPPVIDRRGVLPVGIGADQAGIDGKTVTANKPFGNAPPDHCLKQLPEEITLPEPAMAVLGEGGVVGHRIGQIKAAEPAISQVQMHFLAKAPLRADTHDIANQQDPDHQFGVDRRPAGGTVEQCQMATYAAQVDEPVVQAQQMIPRHVVFQ